LKYREELAQLNPPRQLKDGRGVRSNSTPEPTRPPSLNTQPDIRRGVSVRQAHLGGAFNNQSDALAGLGQNPQLLNISTNIIPDAHSPMYPDPLVDIRAGPVTYPTLEISDPMGVPGFGLEDRYSSYQHGDMLELGINLGWAYQCRHLDGRCQEYFDDEEELQLHFETHFAFTRIFPPSRFVCSICKGLNQFPTGMCFSCGTDGMIEHLIYGSFIRHRSYQAYSPDGHELFGRNNNSDDPFSASVFSTASPDDMGPGMGNNGMNPGGYNQNFNAYGPGPGSNHGPQNENFDAYSPQQGNFQYRGAQFRQAAELNPIPVRYWYLKGLKTIRRHKVIFIALTLLFAATFVVKTHDWFIAKARMVRVQPNLLIILGFVGLIASFAMCTTYRSFNNPCGARRGGAPLRSTSTLYTHALPFSPAALSFACGSAVPTSFQHGISL